MKAESTNNPDSNGANLKSVVNEQWPRLLIGSIGAGTVAFGIATFLPPTFTARTSLMPPQQQQSTAAAALSQLGALAGLAGGAAGIKSPADQYVALMQSRTVADGIIDEFKLIDVYEAKYRQDAHKELGENVRISAGKKDGLLTVEVDDHDPKRAAAMANAFVTGLKRITTSLAVTEAQQRRAFFEDQLKKTKDSLTRAQISLQASGFNQGALKAEPRAAAEGYAKLRAEVTAAEVRLQAMGRLLTDSATELQQQRATVEALRGQLARAEQRDVGRNDSDYVTKFREFKYQETLFELFARQYELARVDESREGALIQVVDAAVPPERKSKPKRGLIAAAASLTAFIVLLAYFQVRSRRAEQG